LAQIPDAPQHECAQHNVGQLAFGQQQLGQRRPADAQQTAGGISAYGHRIGAVSKQIQAARELAVAMHQQAVHDAAGFAFQDFGVAVQHDIERGFAFAAFQQHGAGWHRDNLAMGRRPINQGGRQHRERLGVQGRQIGRLAGRISGKTVHGFNPKQPGKAARYPKR
jgi:hypothetical protein